MSKPNFVLLLTDDQGSWAVPWHMPELVMPNLEAMAAESIVFENYYCASPVCSPARGSLITGRMPSAHGIHDWLIGGSHPGTYPDTYLEDITTLPQVLNSAGYICGLSGKWHLGHSQKAAPGFDYWYAHRYGGGHYYDAPIWENGEESSQPGYYTDAVRDHALEFLDSVDASNSFFLFAATTAPHHPWGQDEHPQELLGVYRNCDFPSVPRLPRHPWTQTRYDDFEDAFANPEESLRGYCASLTGVDRVLGSIREKLNDKGVADNTIIFYMADNGFSCGHHGVWGKGNGTYPLNFWENSVRVPFVMYVPEALREQYLGTRQPRMIDTHLSSASFFEMVCELADIVPPTDPLRLPSFALAAARGEDILPDSVVVYDEYGGGRMIRSERWKYVARFQGPTELYDMKLDPDENNNLSGNPSYSGIQAQLAQTLEEWFCAHETPRHSAFEQPVTGYGQIHPTWRRDEPRRYEG
ncbi:sulfatase-like hydrolase/transferase [Trueperella pyogenes]|uniref:sulfatase-like hydrolase/transferase n=1 Tax=Trueperella pyogenes TaxID=1661 RepID=UPI0004BA042F|nr:sulfatase-like hydrolase/transferase [Trueperella pyogenes]AZR01593.1 phosphodiesterase [Trueperella pyogenes]AZR02856.1 phosphodiesterase [Trueperella pyogenes]